MWLVAGVLTGGKSTVGAGVGWAPFGTYRNVDERRPRRRVP